MRKACIVVSKPYQGNRMFDPGDAQINRDNCMLPFRMLKSSLAERGIDLSTQDINAIEDSQLVLYIDMPRDLPSEGVKERAYLLLFESKVIKPENWEAHRHAHFKKIFTWNDLYAGRSQYVKMNFPQEIRPAVPFRPFAGRKFCVMIAGNKQVRHPLELYSERLRAIRWFEKSHPDAFDLYGIGWDSPPSGKRKTFFDRGLGKLGFEKKAVSMQRPSYRGRVQAKLEVLREYKFSICYENARDIPGYITEKLIDTLLAGCVPVYWGAPNIRDYVPEACFVDRRKFRTYEDLYGFLQGLDERQHSRYLAAIEDYVHGSAISAFSSETFCETIISATLGRA